MRFFLFFIFLNSTLISGENINNILQSIHKDLITYDKLATKTKSNKHYQPYIVSVLKNKTLVTLGCTTLLDALKLIPNVDISSDNVNYKSLIFRGSNPLSFGQSKLFIDGILVNNIYFDGYSEYLDMPIELIKRVEVIRGPGNKSGNITNYAGSIHVITFAEDMQKNDMFFVKTGSSNYRSTGFRHTYLDKNLKIFTDFYYKKHNHTVFVKNDGLASGIFNFPPLGIDNRYLSSSANVPLDLKNYSLGINLKYKNIYFKSRFYSYKQGSAFGLNYIPSKENNYLKTPNHYLVFGYKKDFPQSSVDTQIGYNYNSSETKSKLAPNGIKLPKISNPTQTVVFPNGIYGENIAKQENLFHTTTFIYDGIKKHSITTSYYISHTYTKDVISKITNRDTGVGIIDYSDTLPFFDKDADRNTYILNISDKYTYSYDLQFLYSLNYEDNTHISPKLEPKLSLVYTVDNVNILKLLYSKSHRTPSWQELYTINNRSRIGNQNLKAEETQTYEVSHIKHFSNDNFIQSTLFFITNKNQITNLTQTNKYINSDKTNHLYGFELEYKGHFTPKDEIYFNISYTDGENTANNTLALVSKILAKGYYIYNYSEKLSLSTIVQYKSPKERTNNDNRDEIPSQTIIDTAINYKNFYKNFNLNFSIKNIFDTKIVYPSKPGTYKDDYPDIGRSFILSFSKEF